MERLDQQTRGRVDFVCSLCGWIKPLDDLSLEARIEYSDSVCYQCWESVTHNACDFCESGRSVYRAYGHLCCVECYEQLNEEV